MEFRFVVLSQVLNRYFTIGLISVSYLKLNINAKTFELNEIAQFDKFSKRDNSKLSGINSQLAAGNVYMIKITYSFLIFVKSSEYPRNDQIHKNVYFTLTQSNSI